MTDESRKIIGKFKEGVLTISEQVSELNRKSLMRYEQLRKVVFPSSLKKLDSHIFYNKESLEEIDFSKVTQLKDIPAHFISKKTSLREFVIPYGVEKVGDGFAGDTTTIKKVFVPSTVKQIGYINGECDNSIDVYLFASGLDLESIEEDVHTLYVLPDDYDDYANQLEELESDAILEEMPDNMMNIYNHEQPSIQSHSKTDMSQNDNNKNKENLNTESQTKGKNITNKEYGFTESDSKQQNSRNMTNKLIPNELNELIQEYLTDGILTAKERQVLLKKAEKMGLDIDEVDLYIDAQVQKFEQEADAIERKKKGKLCPFCNTPVPLLATRCPACEQEITPEASEELQEILDNLEEALVEMKASKNISHSKATIERYVRKAKMYYGENPKIQKLLINIEEETLLAEKRAKDNKRKETISKIIRNKWVWCIVEIIIIAIIVMSLNSRESELNGIYESSYGKDITTVNSGRAAKSESDNIALIKWLVILGGIGIVYVTGKMAIKDNEKQ